MNKLWMCVTRDIFQLPLAVANTAQELGRADHCDRALGADPMIAALPFRCNDLVTALRSQGRSLKKYH